MTKQENPADVVWLVDMNSKFVIRNALESPSLDQWDPNKDKTHIVQRMPLTDDMRRRFPRKLKKTHGWKPGDFLECFGHAILSHEALHVLNRFQPHQELIALDNSLWPKTYKKKQYSLLYSIPIVECLNFEESETVSSIDLGWGQMAWLPKYYQIRDRKNVKLTFHATKIEGLHFWQTAENGGAYFLASDELKSAWDREAIGPMQYFSCRISNT